MLDLWFSFDWCHIQLFFFDPLTHQRMNIFMLLCKINNLELFASKSGGRFVKYINLNLLIRLLQSLISENFLPLFCLFQSWLEMIAFSSIETPKCTISLKVIGMQNIILIYCSFHVLYFKHVHIDEQPEKLSFTPRKWACLLLY